MLSEKDSQFMRFVIEMVNDLYEHADGSPGDGCWDLFAKYDEILMGERLMLFHNPDYEPVWKVK